MGRAPTCGSALGPGAIFAGVALAGAPGGLASGFFADRSKNQSTASSSAGGKRWRSSGRKGGEVDKGREQGI
jgi:hypothetical protein